MRTVHGLIALEARRKYPARPLATGAHFSKCRLYRYSLWRRWGPGPACCFIGLNPSTATETVDDPTIRRCIRFSRDWGFGAYWMLNLFAFRSTDPKGIYSGSPVGLHNDATIVEWCRRAGRVIVAWGNHGAHQDRGNRVLSMIYGAQAGMTDKIYCFGKTKTGQPKHPLYIRADAALEQWIPF